MELLTVRVEKPETINFILGQKHSIKTVQDLHEALIGAVPGIKFGLVFCEASEKCLVRWSGTDPAMIELAKSNALAIGAGHNFLILFGEGFYPPEVAKRGENGAGGLLDLLRHCIARRSSSPPPNTAARFSAWGTVLPPKRVEGEGRGHFCGRLAANSQATWRAYRSRRRLSGSRRPRQKQSR